MPLTVTVDQLFVKVFVAKRVQIGRDWNARDVCSGYWRLYLNDRDGAALADGSRYQPGPPAAFTLRRLGWDFVLINYVITDYKDPVVRVYVLLYYLISVELPLTNHPLLAFRTVGDGLLPNPAFIDWFGSQLIARVTG